MHAISLLVDEHIASIRDIQKHPSRALRGVTRVMRGSKTMGFFFSNEQWDEFLEDLEASASRTLRARVKDARKHLKKGEGVSLKELAKQYGV